MGFHLGFRIAAAGSLAIWVIATGSPDARGHPHANPVRTTTLPELGEERENMGGYGFVASSEAEANTYLNFGCSTPEVAEHLCTYFGASTPAADRIVTDVGRALVLQRVREHAMERLILDRAAVNRDRSTAWPPASALGCFSPRAAGDPDMGALYQALPADQPSDIGVLNPYTPAARAICRAENPENPSHCDATPTLQKFRAAGNVLSSGNMVRAMLFYDQINEWQRTRCATQRAKPTCADLDNQENRLVRSYPAVLGPGVDRTALKRAVYDVLGARGSGTDAERRARGRARYTTGISGWDLNELEGAIADNLAAGVLGDTGASAAVNGRLSTARGSLNDEVAAMRNSYAARLETQVSQVCSRTLEDYIRNDSNVVRQVFADASSQDRGLMRAVLCENNFASAHTRDRASCYGVTHATASPGGERVTRVARRGSGFPYGSSNYYEIITPPTPPGGASTIRMTLHMESSLPEDDETIASAQCPSPPCPGARTLRTRMQQAAQNFFNCQTGGGTPPVTSLNVGSPPAFAAHGMPSVGHCPPSGRMRTPPLQFELTFASSPAPTSTQRTQISNCGSNWVASGEAWARCASLLPRVTINRCFNADLPVASMRDCAAAKTYVVGLCTRTIDMRRRAGAGSTASAFWGANIDDYLDNVSQPAPGPTPSPSPNPARDAAVAACTQTDDCARARCQATARSERPPLHCFTDQMRDDFCERRVDRTTMAPNPDADGDGRPDSALPAEGDASYNRENAANYTLATDTPTVLHEVGHLIGLPDEYTDPTYAFSPPGEHDSMMNSSSETARFYPRHLREILDPSVSCPAPASGGP